MIQPYSSRYNRHRYGQALLLAVLVMVFAALIGVTFITVVASNIGQTGREEERNKARQAAEAGLAFANLQLTNSVWATRWNPANSAVGGVTPPVTTGDPTYAAYWTPFDQAQGWNSSGFAKFPDPRSVNPSQNAPNYLLKVETVAEMDADNNERDKTGDIRITSIGLSPDDPTTFYKVVAYKSGLAQSPFTGAMRSVSNWDFQDGGVPSAKANGASSGTAMAIQNLTAKFPSGNFYVTIGNPGGTLRNAFVTSATANTLTFATNPGAWVDGEHVEIAATIGAPLAVDYDRDGTATVGTDPDVLDPEEVRLAISDITAATPGSAWVNGSLIFSGNTLLQNLRAPQTTGTSPTGQLRASGLIQVTDTNRTKVSGTYGDGTTSGIQRLLSSTEAAFPFAGSDVRALNIISDGANRIGNSPDPTRQNKPFTPPNLASGGDGFGRYRQLTKYSKDGAYDALGDGITDAVQSAAHGYGEGIYINNPQDKERIYDTTINNYREMNALEFHELIFSNEDSKAHLRLGTPEAKATVNKSLEEQHLRGWVSASEFRPRGALVELDATLGKIYVTKESRKDGRELQPTPDGALIYANEGPVATQGWSGPDGTLLGGTYGGKYRQEFDWPENGVIFAEGNIRIRGEMPSALRSLTVVSMNNIYIEGSLSAGTRKVLLLAKKNVLVNPTRVIGSIDEQTRLATVPTAGATSIAVTDATALKVGDWFEIKLPSGPPLRRSVLSTDTSTAPHTVNFVTALPANAYAAGQVVQLVQDPTFTEAPALERPFSRNAIRIEKFEDVVQRRLYLAAGTTQIRLALRHNAERKEAFTVGTQPPGAPPAEPTLNWARMANRLGTAAGQSVLQETEKLLNVEYSQTPGVDGDDTFPNSAVPATQADAVALKLTDLAADMNTEYPSTQWQYDVSIQNQYDTGPNLPPFYFLASVSNRHEWSTQPTGTLAFPDRKDVMGASYPIPMGTSVQAFFNGMPMSLGLFDPVSVLRQFGFNPLYIAANPDDSLEDVLTTDQGFYQSVTGNPTTTAYTDLLTHDNTNYTLDSRIIQVAGTTNGVNGLAMRLNNSDVVPGTTVENYFNASTTSSDIPYYRLSRMKLENSDLFATDGSPNILAPGYTFNIQAYVYAQEGSWLVIPGDLFDSKVRAGYVDLDNSGTQNVTSTTDYESLDLNRDGVVSADEQIAPLRFARYNYQINFTGAIMENQTAPVNAPGGTALYKGAVAEWTDKWATISQEFATAPSPTYGSIKYEFDPSAITAAMIPGNALNNDIGFRPPISPDLIYQTG